MKTTLPRLLPLLALMVTTFVFPAASAAAEDKSDKPSIEEQRRQYTFNVDFAGGTLVQLANSIRPPGGPVFNLVGEKEDLTVQIPALSLRNVDTESLANALNRVVNVRGLEITRAPGPSWGNNVNLPVYIVTKKAQRIEPSGFESFQLAPFLRGHSIDDIIGAIRAAWELNPTHSPAALQLKFHPPTSILLASGSPEALQVTRRVIDSLKPESEPKPKADPASSPQKR